MSTDGILAHAAVVYGYFPAVPQGDDVIVLTEPTGLSARSTSFAPDDAQERFRFTFPRQQRDRFLQLHPEQSTDAFVLHHPEAKYFNT